MKADLDPGVIVQYIPNLLAGAWTTVEITAVAFAIGCVLGLGLALARLSGTRWLTWPAYVYIEFFRTTPPYVQIVWFYFALPVIIGHDLNSFSAASLALGCNIAAFLSELFRTGILGVDLVQWESAKVLGLNRVQTFRHVVMPLAVRLIVAPTGTTLMLLVKGTSLASVIGTLELLRVGQLVTLETFRPVETLTAVAILYFVLTYPIAIGFSRLEKRLRVGTD